nr:reverse transcriptase domain-containing protein [Tanacetum cinerariifolium]
METCSSSRLVSNPSSYTTPSTNSNPKGRNRRRSTQRIEEFSIDELSPPIVTMVDQRTMAQLLQAPTEGYEDAIVVPAIIADNFELKHEIYQLDTFYNALNSIVQDSLNSVAGVVAKVSTNTSSDISPNVAELKDMVKALLLNKKSQIQSHATMKAVEESCISCGDQNMHNQLTNLIDLLTKLVNSNNSSISSSGTLPSNTITNPRSDLKSITTRSGVSYDGPQIPSPPSFLPKVMKNKPEATKDTVHPTNNGLSAPRPNLRPSITYPSRMQNQKLHDKANDQREKFFQIFKDLNFNISFVDALILMPKFSPSIKSLLTNKDKLSLADLGASINLMSLSLWNKLSLPDFSLTCMTLKLADRLISRPVGVAEDVYIKVGTFHIPADFFVINFDADPRVLTSRYSSNYNAMTAKRIGVIDMACEEYSQEVLVFLMKLSEVRKELKICEDKSDKSSIDEPPEAELKNLPPQLEYVFLEGNDKFLVIIVKYLSDEEKTALITVLKSYKQTIAWKLSDIKGGFTVVENKDKELILTRLVTGWRVCFNYRKLNEVTRKDHFPQPFMDQMLERLAGNQYYCFLDDFSGYFQIPIDPKDQVKTTLTCPYGMFAYRRMPFWLCNAPGTFQRCMMEIFHDMIEKTREVFMDDFLVFRNSFQSRLSHLERMLKRCEDANLCLKWENNHFMVKEGIVLGHKISKQGIEGDKAKVDVITKLPYPTTVKGIRSFLGHAGFYRRKLTEAPILIVPDWNMPFELMCDASDFAISAVLGQRQDKHFRPIHYASDHRKVQLNELNEIRNPAYENSLIYKDKTKRFHDSKIKDRVFNIGDKVLLFSSRLKKFSGKLKSHWSGPITISHVYSYGTVKLAQPDGLNFKETGHRLKYYFGEDVPKLIVPDLQTFSKDH